MALVEFKLHTRAERVELGTIAELTGVGGKIALIPSNFNNPDRRVVIVMRKADGTSATVTCSKPVSEGLRSKEIGLRQVQNFPIVEHVTSDGEVIALVSMPSGGGLVEFNVTNEVVEYQAPALDPSELIAW